MKPNKSRHSDSVHDWFRECQSVLLSRLFCTPRVFIGYNRRQSDKDRYREGFGVVLNSENVVLHIKHRLKSPKNRRKRYDKVSSFALPEWQCNASQTGSYVPFNPGSRAWLEAAASAIASLWTEASIELSMCACVHAEFLLVDLCIC